MISTTSFQISKRGVLGISPLKLALQEGRMVKEKHSRVIICHSEVIDKIICPDNLKPGNLLQISGGERALNLQTECLHS
jgi:hypothetical protein